MSHNNRAAGHWRRERFGRPLWPKCAGIMKKAAFCNAFI